MVTARVGQRPSERVAPAAEAAAFLLELQAVEPVVSPKKAKAATARLASPAQVQQAPEL
jgi:hypothetical protein